jgi:uncharacterized damage-inducible protein DinB
MANIKAISLLSQYSPHIGVFVSMMNECRTTTLRHVKGLTIQQLDYLYDKNSNSIGALLMHVCALEVAYQQLSFFERNLLDDAHLSAKWRIPLMLGKEAQETLKGNTTDFYLALLKQTRLETLELLKSKDDTWLWKAGEQPWSPHVTNNYWRWYHVLEDEINHRGQIIWLKKRLPST